MDNSQTPTSNIDRKDSGVYLEDRIPNKNTEQEFGGLSKKLNDTNTFPVGTYRKISEGTSIADSLSYQSKSIQDGIPEVTHRKWLVLFAGFMDFFICAGFPFNMTVLNVAFLEEFGKSKAETSLVQSIATGMFFIAGFPMGTAVSRYGTRKVGIFGGFLAFLGVLLASFVTNLLFLIMTLGFVTGLGLAACFISASTSVGEYFDGKSKLLALSLVSFGSGCGSTIFPYILDFLTRRYGWRGCLLIVSGLMANMVPCFSVCKPRNVGVSSPEATEFESSHNNRNQSFIRKCFSCFQHKYDNKSRLSVVSTISPASTLSSSADDELLVKLKALAKNKVYILFTTAMLITIPSVNCVLIFLITVLQTKGFDLPTSVFLYFFMSLVSTMFRLVPGFCKKIPHMSVLTIPIFFIGIGAVACALLPGATTYEQHLVLLGMLGTMLGGTVTMLSVATMKLVGTKNYSTALGVSVTSVGISNTCAGPIAGYIRDITGSYDTSFYGVSVALIVAMCFYLSAAVTRKCDRDSSESLQKHLESGRRGTRRRSSFLPWKGKVEFIF